MNVIIAAMDEELELLINELKASVIIKYDYMKLYQYGNWLLAVSQIGMVNATMALTTLINDYAISAIYNLGTAGAIKSELDPLIVCAIKKAVYAHADATKFGYAYGQIPRETVSYASDETLLAKAFKRDIVMYLATLATSDVFLGDQTQAQAVNQNFSDEIDLVDMEGTAFFQVAAKNKIPMVSIKVVSDNCFHPCTSATQFNTNMSRAATLIKNIGLKLIGAGK